MKVLHISQTPVAGAAWSWSEAFKEAGYDSACLARSEYNDGRVMPTDYRWPPTAAGKEAIEQTDVLLCYQGHPYRYEWYPRTKPTVFLYVSQPRHIMRSGEKDGWPWAVIGEYQTRLYPGCVAVPNIVPLKHPLFEPGRKPTDRIVIAYSPSNKDKAGWDDKGYEATVRILRHIVDGGNHVPIEADVITGTPFKECMERKARAHIVIDECVTGSYHGNSIQGLALGCVVINNCDAEVANNLRAFTGRDIPFVRSNLDGLSETLSQLVQASPDKLIRMGRADRKWLEDAMPPADMVERWFRPLIDDAISIARDNRPQA